MIKSLILGFTSAAILASCAAKQPVVDMDAVKKKDRLYTGNLNVTFNNKKNADTKCEIYLNGSISPDFKLSPDGFTTFKTPNREVNISKIACPFKDSKDKVWISHEFEVLKPIKKPLDKNEVSYFGDITVNWNFTKKDLDDTNKQLSSVNGRIENRGKFEVATASNFPTHEALAKQKIKELQGETQLKLIENAFQVDPQLAQDKKDAQEDSDY